MMSGQDSHGHGVVRNGFPVPEDLPLLAERFADAGWDTMASVGSYALEASMKLDRGFRLYDDNANWQDWLLGIYEVNGRVVTQTALSLVDERKPGAPLFLFVHYYDPHMPWLSAPDHIVEDFVDPAYAGQVAGDKAGLNHLGTGVIQGTATPADIAHGRALYLAEVAWADRQLGLLLWGLSARNLLEDALVVVVSDHGEMFDEHPTRPYRHGPDVDLPIVHVPFVISGTGRFAAQSTGVVVEDTVRTLDLGTTLLQHAGIGGTLGTDRDLGPVWRGEPHAPLPVAFAEAPQPDAHLRADTWPNADLERAAVSNTHLFTRSVSEDPDGTLFERTAAQPASQDAHPRSLLEEALQGFDARMPAGGRTDFDPDTQAALRALGYLEE